MRFRYGVDTCNSNGDSKMSTQAAFNQALKYIVSLTAGREGGPDPSAIAAEILYRHSDDAGDELVLKARLHRLAAINAKIVQLEAERDAL